MTDRLSKADWIDHGTGSAAAATEEIGGGDGLEVKKLRLSREAGDPRPPVLLDDAPARAEDAQYWPAEV